MRKAETWQKFGTRRCIYPGDAMKQSQKKSMSMISDGKKYACGVLALTDILTVYLLTNLVVRLHRYFPCGFVSALFYWGQNKFIDELSKARRNVRVHDFLRAEVKLLFQTL